MTGGNAFIFSSKYRIARHILFWMSWHIGWTCFLTLIWPPFIDNYIRIGLWIPAFIIYSYPVSYIAIPKLLLKGKYGLLLGALIFWLGPVNLGSRHYNSFEAMSHEIGISRLYGGIHIRYAIEEGLKQGKKIAENINSKLKFLKE